MRSVTVNCDRCGGEVTPPDQFDVLAIQGSFFNIDAEQERVGPTMIVDLCGECRSLFMNFLEIPKPDKKED